MRIIRNVLVPRDPSAAFSALPDSMRARASWAALKLNRLISPSAFVAKICERFATAAAWMTLLASSSVMALSTGGGGGTPTFTTTYYEQGNLIRAGEEVQALGPNLMGDTVNEYSGSLAFTQTDFELPGNNPLSMAVARHLATGSRQAALAGGLFGQVLCRGCNLQKGNKTPEPPPPLPNTPSPPPPPPRL